MHITCWNVNSLKARLGHVLDYCKSDQTDCILLQELKLADDAFPHDEFSAIGWNTAAHGQKTYNGVAILSRHDITEITKGLPCLTEDDKADEQSRYIEATVSGFRVGSIYLPNGNPCPGPKFDYKLAWMRRLHARAQTLLAEEIPVVLAGDYNVMPQDIDCYDPSAWKGDALWNPDSRAAFFSLLNLGYTDAIRAIHPQGAQYSYWDYQAGAWQRDNGIRIDHLLLSPEASTRLNSAGVDKTPRGLERPSDHTPVWAEFAEI